jgi:hypothetical protein
MNKIDLGLDTRVEERLETYEKLGYRVLRCSAARGEGLKVFADLLDGGTTVLADNRGWGNPAYSTPSCPDWAGKPARCRKNIIGENIRPPWRR